MFLFSDAREIRFRFGPNIEEVQHVLRANHVDFGTPYDLPTLAQALDSNPKLREDLTDFARSIMQREKDISLRTVLNIIAVASGGPQIAATEEDLTKPVNTLDDFLIQVGANPASPQTPEDLSAGLATEEGRQHESHQAVSLAPSPRHHETYIEQSTDDGDLNNLAPIDTLTDAPVHYDPSEARNVFAESLTRLELNALQMKHYLDSIDQRISRMEPRLESHPAYVTPPSPHPPRHAPIERYSAAIVSETVPYPPQEEPLPPQPVPNQSYESPEMHELAKIIDSHPDSRPGSSPSLLAIPVIALCTAIALTLLLNWGLAENRSSNSIHPAIPSKPTTPPTGLASATITSASKNASGQLRESDAQILPPQRVTEHTSSHSTTIRHHASSSAASIHPSTTVAEASPQPSQPTHSALTSALSDETSDTSEPINVSSGVMAANVLSAPPPVYPILAKLTRMHGEVVMQAVVSRDGTIEHVHVIKGHRLLRGAATDAVRAWRYRPFLVEGHPVEVATTVSVDFKPPE